jgi:hypothetical protein
MKHPTSRKSFEEAAVAAFPFGLRDAARHAVGELRAMVDDTYRQPAEHLEVKGFRINIPRRLHFLEGAEPLTRLDGLSLPARCLLTRATDGHLRQRALATIVDTSAASAVPFIALLIGDYVVEIVRVIEAALPSLDRAAYTNFVLENRSTMRLLRSRATSYWNAYYRHEYPTRAAYPGLVVLHQLESWAA